MMNTETWKRMIMRYKYTTEYIAVVVTVLLVIEIVQAARL